MNRHLTNLLDGIASVFDFAPSAQPYSLPRHGFSRDQSALRQDVRQVGNDLRKVMHRYGQSHRQGSSQIK